MFSICIPTYNCADTIKDTIEDILAQSIQGFEIIISDDKSTDNIEEVVNTFNDPRIRFVKNYKERLGCGGNQEKCRKLATGDFIIMLPGKARISKDMLWRYYNIFKDLPHVGAITRPYFWFGKNVEYAVRAKDVPYPIDLIIYIDNDIDKVISVFNTVDNAGGIAYRRKFLTTPFNPTPFVEFTYPFAEIFKHHPVVLVSDYMTAFPAFKHSHSQDKEVYIKSPIQNWVDLFNGVFFEDKFTKLREGMIDKFVAVNYMGLVQIRNYGTYKQYLREVWYLIKYRPMNLLNINFWMFTLGTAVIPRKVLIDLVKKFKENKRLNVRLF